MNLGVLHHLADPPRGLARLAAHMQPDGFLVLWLYGKHGRMRLNLNQQMIALLQKPGDGWRERVDIAKRALRGLPAKMLECHFSVADQKLEDDFPKAREWILEHDQWVADQFVHPVERTVDLDDVLQLLDGAGLTLDTWLGVSEDPARWAGNDELIRERIERLDHRDRLRFIDRLIKPNYYFLVARFSTR
jgi:hypothetical protein